MLNEMIDENNYTFCQCCKVTSEALAPHHIVFQSEKPKHKHLHDRRNLILVRQKCHTRFHDNKHKERAKYIKERDLTELFGNDILPLK